MSKVIRKKIKELFTEYINGVALKSDKFQIEKTATNLPVLKIANVGQRETNFEHCHYYELSGLESFIANKGDLAFSLTGSLGYVSIVTEECIVNQRVLVIKNKPQYSNLLEIVRPIIKSKNFTNYCFSKATSESNKNISPNVILDYEIPVYIDDNGKYDLEKQRELAIQYVNIENQRQIIQEKIDKIKDISICLDDETLTYKEIPLNEIIEHENGRAEYTKTWCQQHKGKYPIYSANNQEAIDFIDTYDYDGRFLTYSKNGCAGYITILDGKFSINGDRCILKLNKDYVNLIDILYLKYFLEPIFRNNKKGRIGILGKNEFTKLNSSMIKNLNIQVPIPIDDKGNFDFKKQCEIANKFEQTEKIKENLIKKMNELLEISII